MQTKTRITAITTAVSLALSALPALATASATPSAANCKIHLGVYQDDNDVSKLGDGVATCSGSVAAGVVQALEARVSNSGLLGHSKETTWIPTLRRARLSLAMDRVDATGVVQQLGLRAYLSGRDDGVVTGTARVARRTFMVVGTARFVPESRIGLCIPIPRLSWARGTFELAVKLVEKVHKSI